MVISHSVGSNSMLFRVLCSGQEWHVVCQRVRKVVLFLLWGILLASLLPAVDKGRGSKSVEVLRVWEVYDQRFQYMSLQDAQCLSESLDADDGSSAWHVWSRAAETALADAYRFSGGPNPSRG